MIIDSHQHCWKLARGDYGWLVPDMKRLYQNYLPVDLQPLLAQQKVAKTVLIQAAPTVRETEYLLALARANDFIAGVVGWVDMAGSEAGNTLQRLKSNRFFKGIRPMIQDIDDPEWMLRSELEPAFHTLITQELCFDALVKPVHLAPLKQLLCRYPELDAVIDHGGKPDIANQEFSAWADAIQALASETNAYCKLSGLLTQAQEGATAEALIPYVQHLLECFGCERILWGSDWPVLNLVSSYQGWMTITKHMLSKLDSRAQAMIMGENAARFYRLSI